MFATVLSMATSIICLQHLVLRKVRSEDQFVDKHES